MKRIPFGFLGIIFVLAGLILRPATPRDGWYMQHLVSERFLPNLASDLFVIIGLSFFVIAIRRKILGGGRRS
jgi:hypothetical protein